MAVDDTIEWDSLLDKKPFLQKKPQKSKLVSVPLEPVISDDKYQPNFGFFDKLFSSSKQKKITKAEDLYQSDHDVWNKTKHDIDLENKKNESDFSISIKKWEDAKSKYEEKQRVNNKKILEKKDQYLNKEPDAISDYCEMVLTNSEYPDYFPQQWDLDYQAESEILIVDYSLPDIDSLPSIKTVKYNISRDEFTETHLSNAALNKLYDQLLYQIALRTIHKLYEADVVHYSALIN